jgi:hypothetical protein
MYVTLTTDYFHICPSPSQGQVFEIKYEGNTGEFSLRVEVLARLQGRMTTEYSLVLPDPKGNAIINIL